MSKETNLCMITTAERQKKLIFLRSKKATDYFSYCEEMLYFDSVPFEKEEDFFSSV